ncbi:MAG: NYN domain-containing protein [Acidobacteriota bacterium]|nr:NYN domain-containing protein [Acidobacteriota bacterium]
MPYYLDGNNLIGLARRTARPGEDDRAALLSEIAARLRGNRSSIRVFFDGEGRAASFGSLTVSGTGGSADEAIVREIGKAADPRQITVVTADRELARRTRDFGAKTMAPADFWSRFGGSAAPERSKPAQVDVDEWLDYFADPKNRR